MRETFYTFIKLHLSDFQKNRLLRYITNLNRDNKGLRFMVKQASVITEDNIKDFNPNEIYSIPLNSIQLRRVENMKAKKQKWVFLYLRWAQIDYFRKCEEHFNNFTRNKKLDILPKEEQVLNKDMLEIING